MQFINGCRLLTYGLHAAYIIKNTKLCHLTCIATEKHKLYHSASYLSHKPTCKVMHRLLKHLQLSQTQMHTKYNIKWHINRHWICWIFKTNLSFQVLLYSCTVNQTKMCYYYFILLLLLLIIIILFTNNKSYYTIIAPKIHPPASMFTVGWKRNHFQIPWSNWLLIKWNSVTKENNECAWSGM